MEIEKKLTLIFPIFNSNDEEIKKIKNYSEQISYYFDVIVASDSKKMNKYKTLFKEKFFVEADLNRGKFNLIKNIVKERVKTPFYKVVDPDDFIDVNYLIKFNKKISKLSDNTIIRFFESNFFYKEGEKIKKRIIASYVNENTIWPTKHMLNTKLDAPISKSSDVLLSMVSFLSNDFKIKNYIKNFYIYKRSNGISSTNKDLDTTLKYIEELNLFLDIMIDNNEKNIMRSPSFFDYKWAHNSLINIDIPFSTKEKILNKIFDKLKICAKDNKKWKIKWNDKDKVILMRELKNGNKI